MRNTVIAVGLFVCMFGFLSGANASAAELELASISKSTESMEISGAVRDALSPVLASKASQAQSQTVSKKSLVKHTVKKNENLSMIADKYDTTWRRIYDKNTKISDPDVIAQGDVLVIPRAGEKLAHRKLPKTTKTTAQTSPVAASASSAYAARQVAPSASRIQRGSSAGNAYYAGYCTWYAKSRRPDMPNNLGNADTWVMRAAAQGFATGSTPRAGAIGQQGMHVVYVERVNRNGTVTISEMNYRGFGVVSSRTVPASTFRYIY